MKNIQHVNQNSKTIEIKNLMFRYPGNKKSKWHIDDISLSFEKGKWTTIIGPNGSGKSTLAKIIIGLNKYKKGSIKINKKNIYSYKNKDLAKMLAYIPQEIDIPYGTSVYDFVSFGRTPYLGITGILSKKDKMFIKNAMQQTSTWAWKNKLVNELSGGQKQKVLIAMILAQDANIILLDEPTTFLDIRNQYELLQMIKNEHLKGKTIITILHDINQAVQYSNYLYIMKNGKIFTEGIPNKVINKKTLKQVYGIEVTLNKTGTRKYINDVCILDHTN